jgi:hypothetical protein
VDARERKSKGQFQATKQEKRKPSKHGPYHLPHPQHLRPELGGTLLSSFVFDSLLCCWLLLVFDQQDASLVPYEHSFVSSSSVILPKRYLLLLQNDACAALLSAIPKGNELCSCDTVISGFIDVTVEAKASCTLPDFESEPTRETEPCKLDIVGKGSALSFAFGGGAVDLDLDSVCDFGPGTVTMDVGASLEVAAQNPISLKECTIGLTVDAEANPTCTCKDLGCDKKPFAAQITCTLPGSWEFDECVDLTEIASTLEEFIID